MGADLKPPLAAIPPEVVAAADYEPLARERMGDAAWAWLQGGAAEETTLLDNQRAFDRLKLLPRVLADMAGGHTRLELFGQEYEHPIFIAPVAFQRMVHPEGELATVQAASAMRAGMVVSTQASVALESIARAASSPLWFQLYIQPDREFTAALVHRAEAAGYRALVLTVDAPVSGARNREQRSGFALAPGISAINLQGMRALPPQAARAGESPLLASALVASAPTWGDVAWLRSTTRLPILLKGVLHPDDARRALDEGVGGVIVSNHGGRVLDTVPASIDALPAVSRAVGGRVPVLLDGGIRRGTDILKAIALGASAVLVGRPIMHGLAAAGALGVVHVLHILRTELEMAMVLCGRRRLADVDESLVRGPGQRVV
jgi:4-hydroxymandelate oxidase